MRIYLDSNVLLKLMRKKDPQLRQHVEQLFEKARSRACECITSNFTVMEMLNDEQKKQFFKVEIHKGNIDIGALYSQRGQRKLSAVSLSRVNTRVREWLQSIEYAIKIVDPKEDVYSIALPIASFSNVFAPDCMHLANALLLGAELILTEDQHFYDCVQVQLASRTRLRKAVAKALLQATGSAQLDIKAVKASEVNQYV